MARLQIDLVTLVLDNAVRIDLSDPPRDQIEDRMRAVVRELSIDERNVALPRVRHISACLAALEQELASTSRPATHAATPAGRNVRPKL